MNDKLRKINKLKGRNEEEEEQYKCGANVLIKNNFKDFPQSWIIINLKNKI